MITDSSVVLQRRKVRKCCAETGCFFWFTGYPERKWCDRCRIRRKNARAYQRRKERQNTHEIHTA